MCRDGFKANCRGCGRKLTCRDDYPICEDPCAFGHRPRARVYHDSVSGFWQWRCQTCPNFGGGGRTWSGTMYGAELHLEQHKRWLAQ